MQRTWRPMRQLAGEADADKAVEEFRLCKECAKIIVVPREAGFGKTLFSNGRVGAEARA